MAKMSPVPMTAVTPFRPNPDVGFCRFCFGEGPIVRGVSSFATLIAVLLLAFAAKYERAIITAATNAPALVTTADAASMSEPLE